MSLRYVVEGVPRSGKNAMRIMKHRHGKLFVGKSSRAHAYIESARTQLMIQQGRRHFCDSTCEVRLAIFRPDKRRIDLDNMVSSVFDAMKGIVVADDDLIVRLVAEKAMDRRRPRVEITVTPMGAA